MGQTLKYTFNSNGWEHRILIEMPNHIISSEKFEVNYEITDISTGKATINLPESKVYFENPILIKPYKEGGKIKMLKSIKIPKFILWQIETK